MNTQKDKQEHTENLSRKEAIEKMQELVQHNNTMCMFTTSLDSTPLHSRPMSIVNVDDEGNFWFLSANDSNKNKNIAHDKRVQLFSTNSSNSEYLTVYGSASISTDKKKIHELWKPIAKAWFTEGEDDPSITVIKVVPQDAFYWDTKNGKMISMLKILASVVAGVTMDDSVEGALRVR